MPRRAETVSVLLAALLVTAPAFGQSREAARRHFDDGVQAASEARWDDAIREFEAARDIRSTPAVAYNLALAYRAVGRNTEAIEQFRAFLASAPAQDVDRRREVQEYIDQLSRALAVLEFDIQPPNASVLVDGHAVEAGARHAQADPGRHTITVQADGYTPRVRTLTLTPGHTEIISERLIATARAARLVIDTNDPRSSIRLGNRALSSGSADEFIESGSYHLTVQAPGHVPAQRDITLRAGQSMRIRFDLAPEHPLFRNPWFWGGVGAGVAAITIGAVFWIIAPRPVSELGYPVCVGCMP